MTFYLNDTMLDLDKPVIIKYKGWLLGSFNVIRSQQTILETLRDPEDYYTAKVRVGMP
jgi:hypothetical protein